MAHTHINSLAAMVSAAVRSLDAGRCSRCQRAEAVVADGSGSAFCRVCYAHHLTDLQAQRSESQDALDRLGLARRRLARLDIQQIVRSAS